MSVFKSFFYSQVMNKMFAFKVFLHTWLPVCHPTSSTIPLGDGVTRIRREKTSSRKKDAALKKGGKDVDPRFREIWEQKRLGGSEGSWTRKRIIQMMEAQGVQNKMSHSIYKALKDIPVLRRIINKAKGIAVPVQGMTLYDSVHVLSR